MREQERQQAAALIIQRCCKVEWPRDCLLIQVRPPPTPTLEPRVRWWCVMPAD